MFKLAQQRFIMNIRLKIIFLSSSFVTKFYQNGKQEQEPIMKLSAAYRRIVLMKNCEEIRIKDTDKK